MRIKLFTAIVGLLFCVHSGYADTKINSETAKLNNATLTETTNPESSGENSSLRKNTDRTRKLIPAKHDIKSNDKRTDRIALEEIPAIKTDTPTQEKSASNVAQSDNAEVTTTPQESTIKPVVKQQTSTQNNYKKRRTVNEKNVPATFVTNTNTNNNYPHVRENKNIQEEDDTDLSTFFNDVKIKKLAKQLKRQKSYPEEKEITADWLLTAGKAFPAEKPFKMARIKFIPGGVPKDIWNWYPEADKTMLIQTKKKTFINIDTGWNYAEPRKLDELLKYNILFITANGEFNPSKQDLENLKKYLQQGGFIYADDCVDTERRDAFFKKFKAVIENFFGQKMQKLPDSHAIYHCFYDLPAGAPDTHPLSIKHGGWGLYLNNRLVIFLTSGDIHCGWESRFARLKKNKPMFDSQAETLALNMGANIIVYALSRPNSPDAKQ